MTQSQFDQATEIQKELTHLRYLFSEAKRVIELTNAEAHTHIPEVDPDSLALSIELVSCHLNRTDTLCALSATYLLPSDISIIEIVQAYLARISDRILTLESQFDEL